MPSYGVCPSVCLLRSCILSKRIKKSSEKLHRRVATPFWFLRTERGLTKASNAVGIGKKSRFWANIWLRRVLSTMRPSSVIHTAASNRSMLMTLNADINKRRRLLMPGDGLRSVYDKSLNITLKTTERNLIVRSDKSKTEGTNNKRLQSR